MKALLNGQRLRVPFPFQPVTAFKADPISGNRKRYPSLSNLSGITAGLSNMSRAAWPYSNFSRNTGTGNQDGRFRLFPKADEKSLLLI